MKRLALVLLVACGDDARTGPDAVLPVDGVLVVDAAPDGEGCQVPVLPDATPASTAPTCTAAGLPGSCIDVAACVESRSPQAGACPGGAEIQCCTPRYGAAIACDPNARPLPNACLVEEALDPGCPAGMVQIDTFCIDAFEASLADASPFHPPTGTPRAVSLRGAVPQAHISQVQAAAACSAAGKRLCTDDEWLRACRGPGDTQYPYGPTRMPGVCNDARATHPAVELYGTAASWVFSHLDSPCFNQLAASLGRTGEQAGCVTAEGAFDMMGNLHEWTADPAGTFRGGFYVDTRLNGEGCAYRTTAHDVSYRDYSTGFRCCAAPR